MPQSPPDEASLRNTIVELKSIYERGLRRLSRLGARLEESQDANAPMEDLTGILSEMDAAESLLGDLCRVWYGFPLQVRQGLSREMDALRHSAAECLQLIDVTIQAVASRRAGVCTRVDEGADRNRAIRAYAQALRR